MGTQAVRAKQIRTRRNRWINRYGSIVILLLLLFVVNPELQAFLLVANYIGLDLMIFFIVIQLQNLLPVIPANLNQMGGLPVRCRLCHSARHDSHSRAALGACPRVGGLDHITFRFVEEHVVPRATAGIARGLTVAGRNERNSFRSAVISR